MSDMIALSLNSLDTFVKHDLIAELVGSYPSGMPKKKAEPQESNEKVPIDPVRQGVGLRLAAAREAKGLTQQQVADRFGMNKATVSAWETGRGDPGIYRLQDLMKLYGLSADAVLLEDSLSPDAISLAVEFDALTEKQKSILRALWMAYISTATDDSEVERKMPITKPVEVDKGDKED